MNSLDQRVQLLEDRVAIQQTKTLFTRAFDEAISSGHSWQAVDAHIRADYRWQSDHFEAIEGRTAFAQFGRRFGERISFVQQFLSGNAVEISPDRQSARARWVLWQPFTLGDEPWILGGKSRDQFVRDGDTWSLISTSIAVDFLAPWTTGWGERLISPAWKWGDN